MTSKRKYTLRTGSSPKTGGRQRGTPNRFTADVRHREEATASDNPVVYSSVPCIAHRLVNEVKARRLSPAAARVQLQKAYLALLESEQARTAEHKAQAAREEAARAAAERERKAAQAAEEARPAALQRQELQRTAAVQNCINLVRQRREAQYPGAASICEREASALSGPQLRCI
jgi:hypothetical protein